MATLSLPFHLFSANANLVTYVPDSQPVRILTITCYTNLYQLTTAKTLKSITTICRRTSSTELI